MRGAGRHDQIVVRQALAAIEYQLFGGGVNPVDVGQQHPEADLLAQDPADRRGDIAWGQSRRGHLVQKRLKDVVIVTIDDRHLAGDLAQPPRRGQAGKPAANNHNLGEGGHVLYSMRCMPKPGVAPPESTVVTACPLDCPDACTLTVTVRGGRVMKIDGSTENHITNGYICAKVRRFPERVYGEDRLLYPAMRRGTKGTGLFKRVTWDDALDLIASKMLEARDGAGAETILPLCYGGSNGFLTQDYADAILFRRFGTSRLLKTVCAAPTGAANLGLYGKMASVSYEDYPAAKMIIVWGVNPGVSGIHLMPFLKEARDNGAFIVVIDPRATGIARQADLHLAVRPGTDLPVALSIHRYLFEEGHAEPDVPGCAHQRRRATAREGARVDVRARRRGERRQRRSVAATGRAICEDLTGAREVRLGPRAQSQRRQRRGGGAGAARGGRQVRRPWRRVLDEQLGVVEHRSHVGHRCRAADARGQYEQGRTHPHRTRGGAGQHAVRLQLQSGGDPSRSAARDPRSRTRKPVHGGIRPGHSPTRRCMPTSCCRRRRSSSTTILPRGTGR